MNMLLENPPSQSKPWCNIYVDSMTSYRNSNVRGNLNVGKELVSSIAKINTLTINDGQPINISYYNDIQNNVRYCGEIVAENSCSYSRLGKQVTLKIGKFSYVNSKVSHSWLSFRSNDNAKDYFELESLDECLRPSDQLQFPIPVFSSGKRSMGYLEIEPDGSVKVYLESNGSNERGLFSTCVSYLV